MESRLFARLRTGAMLWTLGVCAPALAQLHAGDILMYDSPVAERIITGMVDSASGQPGYNVRVFGAAFVDAPNFTSNPGLDTDIGAFPPNSQIGFTIRRALRRWDGAAFSEIPTERIQVKFGPLGPVISPTDDTPVVGFSMSVNSQGQFHHHPGFTLLSPAGDGIYLLELELWSNVPGIGTSLPYWMVFNQNRPQSEEDDAFAWAVTNLVGCPADVDGNGYVNGDDYDAMSAAFEAGC